MQGIRLLIVDQDIAFVDQVVTMLKKSSIIINWIKASKDVLARIDFLLPDVIILISDMPGINTMKILKMIKVRYPLIEVIMLVEGNNIREAILGMQKGATDYIKKTSGSDELMGKIQLAYRKKVRHQEKIDRFEKILV